MCKHNFELRVIDNTVITFCKKCGEIGDIEAKPSIEYPIHWVPYYVPNPYQYYPYEYNWQLGDSTSGFVDCTHSSDLNSIGTTTAAVTELTGATADNSTFAWENTASLISEDELNTVFVDVLFGPGRPVK